MVDATGVHAVIVTHNRREPLREELAAVAAQERPPNAVLVRRQREQ